MMLVLGACVMLPAHIVGGWPWGGFAMSVLVYGANLLVWEALAQVLNTVNFGDVN